VGDIKDRMETDSLENANVDVCLVTSQQGSHSSTVHMYSVDSYNFFMLKQTALSLCVFQWYCKIHSIIQGDQKVSVHLTSVL